MTLKLDGLEANILILALNTAIDSDKHDKEVEQMMVRLSYKVNDMIDLKNLANKNMDR
jgi:hypothetical protein